MYAFFVQLYASIFAGQWVDIPNPQTSIRRGLFLFIDGCQQWLMNALGGHFETLQKIDFFKETAETILNGQYYLDQSYIIIALVLALVTMLIICFAVFGLVKKIFSIFFSGVR